MGGWSTSLIISGVITVIIGIFTGVTPELDSGHYFFCMESVGTFMAFFSYVKADCTNLFLFNTLPAFCFIVGIIARIVGR